MKQVRMSRILIALFMIFTLIIGCSTSSFAVTIGSGTQSYRLNVLNAIGVADETYNSDNICTRGQFAKLLVLSSSYNEEGNVTLTSAAANDVPASNENAAYIKTALVQGWMRTRLGGVFSPDSPLTLNDAAKATLTCLGYTDEDFPTDVLSERLAMFKSLNLDEGVTAVNGTDSLTMTDAVNVIYNLLRSYTKGSQSIYGSALDLTLASDGELNATNVLQAKMVGPILVKSLTELENAFPFDIDSAIYYYDDTNAGKYGKSYMENHITSNGWLVVYYNEATQTIWAYGEGTDDSVRRCVYGQVTAISYDNENIAAPDKVYVNAIEYTLSSEDAKFMFSLNGTIQVGDYVVMVVENNSDESTEQTTVPDEVIGVVEWSSGDYADSDYIIAPSNDIYYGPAGTNG